MATSRSRSPVRDAHSRHRSPRDTLHKPTSTRLPLNARPLSKHDLAAYKSLFAVYLDVQKGIDIESLGDREVKGRWKSFVGRWNRADLAEGWYDPVTRRKAQASAGEGDTSRGVKRRRSPPPDEPPAHPHLHARRPSISASSSSPSPSEDEDGDGDIGPTPLRSLTTTNNDPTRRSGPTIPSRSDLTLRNELLSTESSAHRHAQHLERQADRALRRSRLDDLQPRADAGSRERRLEKRAETREANASFAAARESGGYADDAEEGDGDVLGGGGAEDYARQRGEVQRKKTEREVRREEVWRARAAEREERVREAREREERTMEGLRRIARERFGGVPGGDGPSAAG